MPHLPLVPLDIQNHIGQIIIALLVLMGQVYSTYDKRKLRKEERAARTEEKLERDMAIADLMEAQKAATQSLADLAELQSMEVARKLEEVHTDLETNTQLSEKAFSEANNFNSKLQVIVEADHEKLLQGRLHELIGAQQEKRIDRLEHKSDVQKVEVVQPDDKPVPVMEVKAGE